MHSAVWVMQAFERMQHSWSSSTVMMSCRLYQNATALLRRWKTSEVGMHITRRSTKFCITAEFQTRVHTVHEGILYLKLYSTYLLFLSHTCTLVWHMFVLLQQTTSQLWCLSGSKREDYQNCSVLYCVLKLYTVISFVFLLCIFVV